MYYIRQKEKKKVVNYNVMGDVLPSACAKPPFIGLAASRTTESEAGGFLEREMADNRTWVNLIPLVRIYSCG